MTWRDFIFKAIGVPFAQDGRGYDGWDCYGLVWCGYRDVLGMELQPYACDVRNHLRLAKIFREAIKNEWTEVAEQVGAVAVVPRDTRPIHCGLVMPNRMLLHCEADVWTIQQPLNTLKVESYHVPLAG